ncbi:MAG: thioesterase family protein [Porticoccaceae bacterium]|nr:thioesterase family protein [Porticoccaceae bacterium]
MLQSAPYVQALGIELLECGGGHALTRMRANARNAVSASDPRIAPMALLGLIDHSAGFAMAGLIEPDTGLSTFDMRVDFAHQNPIAKEVLTETRIVLKDAYSFTFQSWTLDTEGATVAIGAGLFRLGSFPGSIAPGQELRTDNGSHNGANCLTETLGLENSATGLSLKANQHSNIGWHLANAVHGGAIGALLMASCQQRAEMDGEIAAGKRLASLHIRYLRPARGLLPLLANSQIGRQGQAASYIEASCFHEQGKDIATAEATFVQC